MTDAQKPIERVIVPKQLIEDLFKIIQDAQHPNTPFRVVVGLLQAVQSSAMPYAEPKSEADPAKE